MNEYDILSTACRALRRLIKQLLRRPASSARLPGSASDALPDVDVDLSRPETEERWGRYVAAAE